MKRIICLILCAFFLFSGCSSSIIDDEKETVGIAENENDDGDELIIDTAKGGEMVGAWLSYLEIKPPEGFEKKENYRRYICEQLDALSKLKVNTLFVQVRPFADSIYPSKLFPSSAYVAKVQGGKLPFDFLELIISCAKEYDIAVHAWINPFRIQKEYAPEKLCKSSTAKKWLDEKSENVVKAAGGLYFNPACSEVSRLIIAGIRELLENYELAGIHIDDYFYPTTDEGFDSVQYSRYVKSGGKLSLSDWRRENVSSLVAGIYNAVKSFGNDKLFSISPGGNIEKDRSELFADVERWCSQEGFCDIMIPQIYYGFENETLPFESCAAQWKKMTNEKVKLCAGLALYKAGKEDAYAGKGKNEWTENSDIISRQVDYVRQCGYSGFCLYSAGFVNFNKNFAGRETKNLSDVV